MDGPRIGGAWWGDARSGAVDAGARRSAGMRLDMASA